MHLYVRADADGTIGIGHIMRCLALSQTWRDQGGEVTFISHCEAEHLKQKIQQEGIHFIPVDKACPDPEDLESTVKFLTRMHKSNTEDWFVLDGYHFTSDYQKIIHEVGAHLLVLDDMNHLAHYHADIILNQNNDAHQMIYRCEEDTILLRGTPYVFLRKEFLEYRNFNRVIPNSAKKIMVSLGGADPDNVTLKVIQALKLLSEMQMEITVVVGPANRHQELLQSTLESSGLNYNLLINPPDMVGLMADADLAITAGGGTYWELAYMGVPCLMIVLAENQKGVAEELARSGAVMNLGYPNLLSCDDIAQAITSMIVSKCKRKMMSKTGQVMIDGNGASLTINAMKAYKRSDRISQ